MTSLGLGKHAPGLESRSRKEDWLGARGHNSRFHEAVDHRFLMPRGLCKQKAAPRATARYNSFFLYFLLCSTSLVPVLATFPSRQSITYMTLARGCVDAQDSMVKMQSFKSASDIPCCQSFRDLHLSGLAFEAFSCSMWGSLALSQARLSCKPPPSYCPASFN